MKTQNIIIIVSLLLLAMACNFPGLADQSPARSTGQVATDVALTLTAFPQTTALANTLPPSTPKTAVTNPATGMPTFTPPPPTPSITASPSPTLSGEPLSSLGEPDWKVSFTNGKDGFYDDDDDQCIITPQNEKLVLTSTMKTVGWHSWSMHYHKIKNFYLQATLHTQSCSGSDEYGLVFRAPDYNNGYFFGLTCDGKVNLRTLRGDYHTVSDWATAAQLHAGSHQTNLVGVMASGNKISLYANNQLIKEIDDATFPEEGMFGAFIAAYNTPGFTVELDDMSYWILD